MAQEIWKYYFFNGEPSNYQVSDFGRVKSYWRGKWRLMKPQYTKKGYRRAHLKLGGIPCKKLVHQLVAELFIPNPYNYDQVNHKDTIRDNNHWENLEWCNNAMNIKHAYDNGLILKRPGGKNPSARRIVRLLGGEVVKNYDCIRGTKVDGFSPSNVWKALNRGNIYKGYIWKYDDCDE